MIWMNNKVIPGATSSEKKKNGEESRSDSRSFTGVKEKKNLLGAFAARIWKKQFM